MADRQFGVRVPEEVAKDIERIVETINDEMPGAAASPASLFRYSIQDYVNRFDSGRRKDIFFPEIPAADLRYEELNDLFEAFNKISDIYEKNAEETRSTPQKEKLLRDLSRYTDTLLKMMGELELINRKKQD